MGRMCGKLTFEYVSGGPSESREWYEVDGTDFPAVRDGEMTGRDLPANTVSAGHVPS
ncbi:hypothetical protein [Jannaschia sp. LMIT008]|uniref:hypothetical protein n=1 Tax=Jannaschia maritima TaxID=3032585 RepID=UPI0028115807|nr:hypothetical protein [Jannaschia sp. LMIT008]